MREKLRVELNHSIIKLLLPKGSDTLIAVDSNTTLNYLDSKSLQAKSQLKASSLQDKKYTKSVDISLDGKILAMSANGYKEFKYFDLSTKKLLNTSARNKNGISCVVVDPKNRYLFSCGDDGSIYAIDERSAQLAFAMPRHIDTITDMVFNQNATLVATSSYDKSIMVFDLGIMDVKFHLRGSADPIKKVLFLPKQKLLSIDTQNNPIIWDLDSGTVFTRPQGIHDDVTKLLLVEDRYFLVGSKLGYIMLFDALSFELISYKYIKINQSISELFYDDVSKDLYVGTINGDVLIFNLYEDLESITALFKEKNYPKILELAEINPLLKDTDVYKNIDILWQKTIALAKEQLEKANKNGALKVCIDFLDIPSKKQELVKLLNEFSEFGKFLHFISQNKLQLAYSMAHNHPIYQETQAYKNLEKKWLDTVLVAKKALENKTSIDEVKKILAPYRGIAKKNIIIQDILQNSLSINRFKSALMANDLKSANIFVKQYPCLRGTKEYIGFMNYIDGLYIEGAKAYQSGDLISAIKIFRVLVELEDFKSELEPLIKNIESEQEFNRSILEDDYVKAYTLLDTYKHLRTSKDALYLNELWEKDYERATVFATKANIDGIKETLKKYLRIKTKYVAIATVVSWCYISELNSAIRAKKDQKNIEDGIKNFVLYFGIIEQIEIFFALFKQYYPSSKLKLESLPQGSLQNYRPAMIVKSILEEKI